MSLCRWFYVYALTERRLALKPFRSHRELHWSLNYCLTWLDSTCIKNNVHEPYQDLGRGLGSRKTGLSPLVMSLLTVPRRCSWYGSSQTNINHRLYIHVYIRQHRTHNARFKNVTFGGSGWIRDEITIISKPSLFNG